MGKRGRPLGFKLSEESKRAISDSKRGQRHKQETRDKISKSLVIFFKHRRPLSEEISNTYLRYEDESICEWMNEEMCEKLDNTEDVFTERTLRNKRRIEILCGHNIELFSHDLNPETLTLFREYCELNKLDKDEALDEIL